MQVNDKKSRIKSVDIAKAIGIFLIVLGHVLKSGELRKFIYAFHVPLFFFLSGICFSTKENKKFMVNKIKTIYIPYIVLSIISILIYVFMGKYVSSSINSNVLDNIIGMMYCNPNMGNMEWNQPLWFLPCLMIQLILINILENLIKNKKYKQKVRCIIVIVLVLCGFILSAYRIYLPFLLEAAMSMTVFTYLGIVVRENKEYIKKSKIYRYLTNRKYITMLIILIILIISYLLSNYNETVSIMHDRYGNYLIYFIVSIAMIGIIMLISNKIDQIWKKQKIISYIGQNTLIILLLHKFPILFFQKLCPIIKDVLNKEDTPINNMLGAIISIIVIVMCIFCKYIVDIRRNKIT